jgi:hypothetical protein
LYKDTLKSKWKVNSELHEDTSEKRGLFLERARGVTPPLNLVSCGELYCWVLTVTVQLEGMAPEQMPQEKPMSSNGKVILPMVYEARQKRQDQIHFTKKFLEVNNLKVK